MDLNIAVEGEQLYRSLIAEITACNWPAVEAMFAPGFQSVHADGARDRATEIQTIKDEKIAKCVLTDFKVTQSGDCLVVTHFQSVEETIDGNRLPVQPSPRLTVWMKNQGKWQMITLANLRTLN
jgi:ketosteroid isomerase-like protein